MSATIKNKKAALDKEAKKPGKLLFEGVSLHEQRLLRYRKYMNEREQSREKEFERLIDWMESAPTNKLTSVLAYALSMNKDDAPEAARLYGAGLESDKSSTKSTPGSTLKADFFKFSIPGDASPDRVEDVRQRVSALGGTFDEVTSNASSSEGAEPSTDTLRIQTPPPWAARPTGRDVSPVDWIKAHYGQVREDGSWDAMGLTRERLRQIDRPLYQAFSTYASRLRRMEKGIPEGFQEFFESSRLRVDAELRAAGVEEPTDAHRVPGLDRATAERLYQAAHRRKLRS